MNQTWIPSTVYAFLKDKADGKELLSEIMPKATYCTPNILWRELLVHQTEMPSLNVLENLHGVANRLQAYRDTVLSQKSIMITSAWRSEKYNKKIGGEPQSKHTLGQACDIQVSDIPPSKVQLILANHNGGLGSYSKFVHIDTASKRRWTGE